MVEKNIEEYVFGLYYLLNRILSRDFLGFDDETNVIYTEMKELEVFINCHRVEYDKWVMEPMFKNPAPVDKRRVKLALKDGD